MLRSLFLIFLFGLIISCKNSFLKTERINKTVTSIDSIKYTAYRLLYNQTGWYTHVDHFLLIDKYGNYLIAKNEDDTMNFFKGQVPDSLLQLIDLTMGSIKSDTSFSYNPLHSYIYDGDTYLIDIQSDSKRRLIHFIPHEAPTQLGHLGEVIENFVSAVNYNRIPRFDLSNYEREILRLDKRTERKPPTIDTSRQFKPI